MGHLLYDILDIGCTYAKIVFGVISTVVLDAWNGEGNREEARGRTLHCSDVTVNSGDTIGPYGWLDLSFCGHPSITVQMVTSDYNRDVSIEVQYGEIIYQHNMLVRLKQRDRNSYPVEYVPNTGIFVIELRRTRGQYARIKSITNHAASVVVISAWSSSNVRPVTAVETIEPDVVEGD